MKLNSPTLFSGEHESCRKHENTATITLLPALSDIVHADDVSDPSQMSHTPDLVHTTSYKVPCDSTAENVVAGSFSRGGESDQKKLEEPLR